MVASVYDASLTRKILKRVGVLWIPLGLVVLLFQQDACQARGLAPKSALSELKNNLSIDAHRG